MIVAVIVCASRKLRTTITSDRDRWSPVSGQSNSAQFQFNSNLSFFPWVSTGSSRTNPISATLFTHAACRRLIFTARYHFKKWLLGSCLWTARKLTFESKKLGMLFYLRIKGVWVQVAQIPLDLKLRECFIASLYITSRIWNSFRLWRESSKLVWLVFQGFSIFLPHDWTVRVLEGFYIDSSLFPTPSLSSVNKDDPAKEEENLLLGPFCGKPACQFINVTPGKARGVCADAFIQRNTILVPDVDSYPGHIACDGDTKSEIVCPLVFEGRCIGVLDLDCLAVRGFDEDDKKGLEKISKLVVESCDWWYQVAFL